MWQYKPTDQLYHHGIKGQKWGVRRFQNPDGTLTPAGIKRYAESIRNATDKVRDAGKKTAEKVTETAKTAKNKIHEFENASKVRQTIAKGAKATAGIMAKVGTAYVADQVFFNGMATDTYKYAAKGIAKHAGRAAVTAYTKARGGYDIRWYDN